ncbi:hypothetical protein MMC30_003106 [Trapelia coarctata]|nr:hypothetical protein [Trapelia coarctata]
MTSFLDLSPEIRLYIYEHLFHQSSGEIHGIRRGGILKTYSRDITCLPWGSGDLETVELPDDGAKEVPKNAQILHTCRVIHCEAAPVFYGINTVNLYAQDNNDIFKWITEVGESNRLLIRHLEIGWSFKLDVAPEANRWPDVLQWITGVEEQDVYQLEKELTNMIAKTSRLLTDTFEVLAPNQKLLSLTIYIPGVELLAWAAWGRATSVYDNYFRQEIRSNPTTHPQACLPNALGKMVGIKTLTIGYIKDLCLAEEIAEAVEAEEIVIWFHQEQLHVWDMLAEERPGWLESGWQLEKDAARKRFGKHQLAAKKLDMPT